jgi:ubiquitin carboxyl-terminal hydrolase 4/11/15
MFEREETLGQDNLWYCPKCKDFVGARKQMKIYKAPKILIFCLKRFKRKDYFSEKIGSYYLLYVD